jgi:O-antigen/teichoic acid export membrane protein
MLIVSFVPSFIIICFETLKHLKKNIRFIEIKNVCVSFLKLGGLNQFNNLMQYGSYRFGIWTISNELGIKEVGVFGLWLTVCDAIWLIPIALATVNQAYAAKPNYSLNQLNKYLLIAVCISATILGIAICLPQTFYIYVLGSDFLHLKNLIMLSCPILIAFSITIMYAYYFSAKGLIKYNTLSSGLGFITILLSTSYLTDKLELRGAVLANCISYTVSVLTTVFLFFRHKRQLKS